MGRMMKSLSIALMALGLSACSTIVPNGAPRSSAPPPATSAPRAAPGAAPTAAPMVAPRPTPPPSAAAATLGSNALTSGVRVVDRFPAQAPDSAARALAAFRLSCPGVQRRNDASGLTQGSDWAAPCAAARGWPDSDANRFFAEQFAAVQVAEGTGLATGYYEPEIAGCRTPSAQCRVPVYGVPADLVQVDLGQFSTQLAGKTIRGRVEGDRFVPYFDRSAIDAGALAGRGLEIAYANDPVELFFLQIQGSGRLRLPDGSVMRIGYAGQNGRDYVGIGRLLADQGAIARGEASMQGLMAYLRRQPDGGTSVMQQNPSWVFFRELTGAGPLGAMGVPVNARASVAADPAFIPLGAPVLLDLDRAETRGIWVAQDTGGAIRGANRVDTFWGAGDEARVIAGGMSARGNVLVLIPRAAAARLPR